MTSPTEDDVRKAAINGELDIIRHYADQIDVGESTLLSRLVDDAVYDGAEELFALLVELRVSPIPWDTVEFANAEDGTCIHTAIDRDRSHMIPGLIELGYNTSYIRSEFQSGTQFPLSLALQHRDLKSARALLEGGANPNIEGVDGVDLEQPLVDFEGTGIFPNFCCRTVAAVNLLHEFGAKFEAPLSGAMGRDKELFPSNPTIEDWALDAATPIVTAASRQDWEVVDRFAELGIGAGKDGEGLEIALLAAYAYDSEKGIEILLGHGVVASKKIQDEVLLSLIPSRSLNEEEATVIRNMGRYFTGELPAGLPEEVRSLLAKDN